MKKRWLAVLITVLVTGLIVFTGCADETEKIVYRDRDPYRGFEPAVLNSNTYTGVGTGLHGPVTVEVVIKNNMLESVRYVSSSENVNAGIPAAIAVAQLIWEKQTTQVDVVSGATYASLAVMEAVRDCIAQAGGTDKMLAWDARTIPLTIRGKPEDFNPDIIVVGGGLGGVYAAMRVADLGGKALLIEQAPHLGGSARFSYGSYTGAGGGSYETGAGDILPNQEALYPGITIATWTNWLKEQNYDVSTVNDEGQNPADPGFTDRTLNPVAGFNLAVSAAYVKSTGPSTKKMIDWGMIIDESNSLGPEYYGYLCDDTAWTFQRLGNNIFFDVEPKMNTFINAGRLGYILNSKVVDILWSGNKVVGVKLENGKEYRASAVIMATGGFACNVELMGRPDMGYDAAGISPKEGGPGAKYYTINCSDTDIGNMTQVLIDKHNVKSLRMDQTRFDGGRIPTVRVGTPHDYSMTAYQHGRIFLNRKGERFGNESMNVGGDSHARVQFEQWGLYRKTEENLVYIVGGANSPGKPNATIQGLTGYYWESDATIDDHEDAIRDLIAKANASTKPPFIPKPEFDVETVVTTLADYDAECEAVDAMTALQKAEYFGSFGKPGAGFLKMDPPYWMVTTSAGVTGTLGGIMLNEKAQVSDRDTGPIPGLYGCGEFGGNIGQTGYTWVVGLNLSHETGYGDVAAYESLKYAGKLTSSPYSN